MALFDYSERKDLERRMREERRLPPGQSATLKWPVLHYGSIPRFDPERWDFRIYGLVQRPVKLTWSEFNQLPKSKVRSDFHCVTRWSRFDNDWEGVKFSEVVKLAHPRADAKHALIHAEQGYTANIPLLDLLQDNVIFATHHDGQPLTPEHGFPLRLVVPQLYAWKSVKWVRGIELLEHDAPGFWEQNGYHSYGDPWKEERFSE